MTKVTKLQVFHLGHVEFNNRSPMPVDGMKDHLKGTLILYSKVKAKLLLLVIQCTIWIPLLCTTTPGHH